MKSFTLIAVGHLASTPEIATKGDTTYTRLCLIGNDYLGRDEEGGAREITTSIYFVAFGVLAEAIVHNARKGDQLIIEGFVQSNNWIDKQGHKQFDYSFVVDSFRFGAPGRLSRDEFAQREEAEGR